MLTVTLTLHEACKEAQGPHAYTCTYTNLHIGFIPKSKLFAVQLLGVLVDCKLSFPIEEWSESAMLLQLSYGHIDRECQFDLL